MNKIYSQLSNIIIGDGTILLSLICTISGAQSGYRIYVKTVPVGAGAVFTFCNKS